MRSNFQTAVVPASLLVAMALSACSIDVNTAYTVPGWYLEQPRQGIMAYPAYVAGPFSYEDCESERLKTPRPDRLLCTHWKTKPSQT